MLANSTSGEEWKIASVPFPWCTSQSSTSTRSAPSESSAYRAATATLEKRQKPIARSASAWWPGGRRPQKPVGALAREQRLGQRRTPPRAAQGGPPRPGLVGYRRRTAAAGAVRGRPSTYDSEGGRRAAARLSRAAPRGLRNPASPALQQRLHGPGSARVARGARPCRARAMRGGGSRAAPRSRYRTRRSVHHAPPHRCGPT